VIGVFFLFRFFVSLFVLVVLLWGAFSWLLSCCWFLGRLYEVALRRLSGVGHHRLKNIQRAALLQKREHVKDLVWFDLLLIISDRGLEGLCGT
jgi:hypothetical protein